MVEERAGALHNDHELLGRVHGATAAAASKGETFTKVCCEYCSLLSQRFIECSSCFPTLVGAHKDI